MALSSLPAVGAVYCTYFDSGYLARGLSLIDSIRTQSDNSTIIVLALDPSVETYFFEKHYPDLVIITLQNLETFEPQLLEVKSSRSQAEYYFTCTPILIRYAQTLLTHSEDVAIYLDADLYFFQSPQLVLEQLGTGSVGIIEHKYSQKYEKRLAKYGKFNVGWLAFRNDEAGKNLLRWYCEATLAWCSDKPLNGLYADQGYLNSFPEWPGTVVIKTLGANLAPWNVGNYRLNLQPQGKIFVDGDLLIFFHFHGLKSRGSRYVTAEMMYGFRLTQPLRTAVYEPYLKTLVGNESKVIDTLPKPIKAQPRGNGLHGLFFRLYKRLLFLFAILTKNSIRIDNA